MLKRDELSDPTSCLNKADDEEPIFVLRAKDPCAAAAVIAWAKEARGHHEPEKIAEAYVSATRMAAWRRLHVKD